MASTEPLQKARTHFQTALQVLDTWIEAAESQDENASTALVKASNDTEAALALVRTIRDPDTSQTTLLKEISEQALALTQELEAQRTPCTKAVNAALRLINGEFKQSAAKCQDLRKVCNQVLVEASKKQIQAREQALAQIAEAGGHADDTLVIPTQRAPVELPKGVGRETAEIEVTDPSLVPRNFCSPDVSLMRAEAYAAKKRGHHLSIPGVRITWRGSGT